MARESNVDRIIREAQERGDFDDLPGTGKPLDLGDTSDPNWWVKRWVARENIDTSQMLPAPLLLRRERASFPESLVDIRTEQGVREALADFNRRVRHELLQPAFGQTSRPIVAGVNVDEMVERWRVLRAEREEQERRRRADAERAAAAAEQSRRDRSWWRRVLGR